LQQGLRPHLVGHGGLELFLHAGFVGRGNRGVELHQHLPGVDFVPVFDEHGFNDAGFQRLDDLGAVRDDDAPRCRGHDVYLAD